MSLTVAIYSEESTREIDYSLELANVMRKLNIDVYKYVDSMNMGYDKKWVDAHIKEESEVSLVDGGLVETGKRRTLSIPSKSIYKGAPIFTVYLTLEKNIVISVTRFYTSYSD